MDALWLEIDYDDGQEQISEITEEEIQDVDVEETDLEESPEMLQEKFELKSENEKRFFRSDEIPTINYKFREKHNFFGRILESIGGIFYDKYKNIKVRASVMTDMGSTDNLEVTADYIEDGEIAFRVKDPGSQFAPGAYRIKFGVFWLLMPTKRLICREKRHIYRWLVWTASGILCAIRIWFWILKRLPVRPRRYQSAMERSF